MTDSQWLPGPVPDYARLSAVMTHAQLDVMAPDLQNLLSDLLGDRFFIEEYDPGYELLGEHVEDAVLLWMRDYQLLYVVNAEGELEGWRYLSSEPNRVHYRSQVLPLDDVPIHVLPLIHENGNLLVAGRNILISNNIIEENASEIDNEELRTEGFRPRTANEVIELLARVLQRSPNEIWILPCMPGERTGHVDLYLLPISDDMIVIPQIEPEGIALLETKSEIRLARADAAFLDRQAAFFEQRHYKVIRLPMLPGLIAPEPEQENACDALYYSPANSLLLHTSERKDIVMPTFDPCGFGFELEALVKKYEQRWRDVMGELGWTVYLVDATDLGRYLGLFRCVTAMVPDPSSFR